MATISNTQRFANDGSYESVRLLLRQLAGKCFARVQKLGLGMDFDDCLGEMNLGYVNATKTWTPEKSKFATWCQMICLQQFNRRIGKEERDRVEMGMVTFTDMGGAESSEGDTARGGLEFLDFFGGEDSDNAYESPEERRERFELTLGKLRTLSPAAKRLVGALIQSETQAQQELVTLHSIATALGMDAKARIGVCQELQRVYGLEHLRITAPRAARVADAA